MPQIAMANHEEFIKRAYTLAQKAAVKGDHPFSALLVVKGEIVLECLNTVNTSGDVTRHPELDILRLASTTISHSDLDQAVLYASTEPCAMCCGETVGQFTNTLLDTHDLLVGCPVVLSRQAINFCTKVLPAVYLLYDGALPVNFSLHFCEENRDSESDCQHAPISNTVNHDCAQQESNLRSNVNGNR